MNLLVLFSAWVPDSTPNSQAWTRYYVRLLKTEYADCDKIISFNFGTAPDFIHLCSEIPGVLLTVQVSEARQINSDAAGYQACLKGASRILHRYDSILFLHTKGITKEFGDLEGFRWYFGDKLLNRKAADEALRTSPDGLHVVHCHPPTFGSDLRKFGALLKKCAPGRTPVMLNATYTIYFVSSRLLIKALEILGPDFLEINISDDFDRFFFELMFPSILLSIGGNLLVLGDHQYNSRLHRDFSYNYDLHHSSQIVIDYISRYLNDDSFIQPIVPMIFGPIDLVSDISAIFSL